MNTSVELVAEAALEAGLRAAAAELLSAEWGEDWVPDGFAGDHPPALRVLARSPSALAGHLSLFVIPTQPSLRVIGFGDLIVAPPKRHQGIARVLVEAALSAPLVQGAEVLLVDTVAAAAVFESLGFTPAPPWSFFYVRDGACRRHPHWLVSARRRLPDRVELLANGDF